MCRQRRQTPPMMPIYSRRQEEASVEVDALEDEMEEDEPRPAHRSRSTLVFAVELARNPLVGSTRMFFYAFFWVKKLVVYLS